MKFRKNQIVKMFNPKTDEIMTEIDTLENISKWCLCAGKKSKDRPFFNDKAYLIEKLQAMRREHSTQLLRPFIALGTKSRARLMKKIQHNHDCFFKLTQGAETAINNDKLILACHMLLYAGRLNERARILPYEDCISAGIIKMQKSSDGGEKSREKGAVQKNPAIREYMINDLVDRMKANNGKLLFDAHRRAKEAAKKKFSEVSMDTLGKKPFRLKDMMPEIKKRYKIMK